MSTPITKTEHVVAIVPLAYAGDEMGLLTLKQAAPYMSLNKKTIQKMCAARRITWHRRGRAYMLHRDTIQAWINANRFDAINPTDRRYAA